MPENLNPITELPETDGNNPSISYKEKLELLRAKREGELQNAPIHTSTELPFSMKTTLGDEFKPALGETYNLARLEDKRRKEEIAKADRQGFWGGLINTTAGGVSMGVLSLLEGFGYLADVAEWTSIAGDEDGSNWFSDAMRSGKDYLREEVFPIHRNNPEKTIDLGDPDWWAFQLQGLIDSAVGFGLMGLGTFGAASKILRGLGAAKLGKRGLDLATSAASAFLMNHAEGKTVSVALYDDLVKQGIDPKIAAESAADVLIAYKSNILLNMLGLRAQLRGMNYTRNFREGGIKAALKEFGIEGIIEGTEEFTGGFFESEGTRSAKIKSGIIEDDQSSYLKRALEYAQTEDAILNFSLGFAGGPVQWGIINKGAMRFVQKSDKAYRAKQEEQIGKNTAALHDALENFTEREVAKQKALRTGDIITYEKLRQESLDETFLNNFMLGTTEILEEEIKSIRELKPEEAKEKGFSENYKEEANKMLEKLKAAEKDYIKINNKYGATDIGAKLIPAIYDTYRKVKQSKETLLNVSNELYVAVNKLNADNYAIYRDPNTLQAINLLALEAELQDVENFAKNNRKLSTTLNPKIQELNAKIAELKAQNGEEVLEATKQKLLNSEELSEVFSLVNKKAQVETAYKLYNEMYTKYSDKEYLKKLESDFEARSKKEAAEEYHTKKAEEAATAGEAQEAAKDAAKQDAKTVINPEQAQQEQPQNEEQPPQVYEEEEYDNFDPYAAIGAAPVSKSDEINKALGISNKGTDSGTETTTQEETPESQEPEEGTSEKEGEEEKTTAGPKESDITPTENGENYNHFDENYEIYRLQEYISNSDKEGDAYSGKRLVFSEFKLLTPSVAIAYGRSRDYIQTAKGKATISNDASREVTNPNVLRPGYLKAGDPVALKPISAAEFKPYTLERDTDFINENGDIITTLKKGTQIDFRTLSDLGNMYVPIGIYNANGELLGYLHAMSFINESNTPSEVIDEERLKLKNIRDEILAKGGITSKIEEVANGWLKYNVQKNETHSVPRFIGSTFRLTNEAFPKLSTIGIATATGTLNNTTDSVITGLLNTKVIPGVPYAVMDTYDGRKLAVPLKTLKVSDTNYGNILKDTIISFFNKNKSEAQKSHLKELGISTLADLRNFLSKYIFLKNNMNNITQGEYFAVQEEDRFYLSMQGNELKFGWSGGKIKTISTNLPTLHESLVKDLKTVIDNLFITYDLGNLTEYSNQPFTVQEYDEAGNITTKTFDNYQEFVKAHTYTSLASNEISNNNESVETYFDNPVFTIAYDTEQGVENKTEPANKEIDETPIPPKSGLYGAYEINDDESNDELPSANEVDDFFESNPELAKTATVSEVKEDVSKQIDDSISSQVKSEKGKKILKLLQGGEYLFSEIKELIEKHTDDIINLTEEQLRQDNLSKSKKQEEVENNKKEVDRLIQDNNIQVNKEYTINEVSSILESLGLSNQAKFILNLIKNVAEKLGVKFVFSDNSQKFVEKSAKGIFFLKDNKIFINVNLIATEGFTKTAVHEIVHGVSRYVVKIVQEVQERKVSNEGYESLSKEQIQAVKNLNILLEELQKDSEFSNEYGITNVDELLAELANEQFVKKLKNKKLNNVSLFDRIISNILKLLGVNTSAYDIALESLESIIKDASEKSLQFAQSQVVNNEDFSKEQIDYKLQLVDKIESNIKQIQKWESQIKDKEVLYNKIQKDLGIPKQQIEILKDFEGNTVLEKFENFKRDFNYDIEINTAKDQKGTKISKELAQRLYSEYRESTGKKDIAGFEEFVKDKNIDLYNDFLPATNENLNNLGLFNPGKITEIQQNETVRFLVGELINDVLINALTKEESLKNWKDYFTAYANKGNSKAVKVLEAWDKFEKAVLEEFENYQKITKDFEYLYQYDNEEGSDNKYGEDRALTQNPNDKISPLLKSMFYRIADTTNKNWLGLPNYLPLEESLPVLQSILANVGPDFHLMKQAMLDNVTAYPWLNNLIDLLEGNSLKNAEVSESQKQNQQRNIDRFQATENQIINAFTQWANKHFVKKYLTLWNYETDEFGGRNYNIRTIESNRSSATTFVINNWLENLKESPITKDVNGEVVIDPDKVAGLKKAYNELKESVEKEELDPAKLQAWLNNFGIDFKDKQVNSLIKAINSKNIGVFSKEFGRNLNLSLVEHFTSANGIFKSLFDRLSSEKNELGLDNYNPLVDNLGIRALAKFYATINKTATPSSFYDGKNVIWSYSPHKYATQQIERLKSDNNFVNELLKLPFNENSYILKYLTNNDNGVPYKSLFREYFDVWYVSGIKKEKSKREFKDLEDFSPAELEKLRIAMFQNQGIKHEKLNKKNLRKIRHIGLTTSDKKNLLGFNLFGHITKASLNKQGKIVDINNDTLNELVKVVYSEYYRITETWKDTITPKLNLDEATPEYKEGSKMFFMFPIFNDKSLDIWDKITDDVYALKDFATVREYVKGIIKQELIKLVDNKLEYWEELGIVNRDEEGNVTYKFIDSKYVKNVAIPNIGPTEYSSKSVITYSALDYEVNQIIQNFNIFQALAGDIAHFYKKDYDETLVNLGKRLAGLIAPGETLANYRTKDIAGLTGKNYTQIVVNDPVSTSKTIRDIVKILDKKNLSDKELKEIENMGNKEKAAYVASKYPNSAPYFNIEGADAQEFITVKEHLYNLFHEGKISDVLYKSSINRLNKAGDNAKFSKEELNILLQPTKPVYYGYHFNPSLKTYYPVYVKSSAIPLIPQLTKGKGLDKIRKAMEALQKDDNLVRLAFKSGVKLGSKKDNSTIFNKDGSVKDDIKFENTILMDRDNFKIQQEVPFDPEKTTINRGSQEVKLIWNNILHIDAIKQEYDKFINNQKELTAHKYGKFLERFTKNGVLDIKKLQAVLLEKAIEDKYPSVVIEYLKLRKDVNGEDVFKLPLYLTDYADKFESLVISLADNDVRKVKSPGFSAALVTEEGFLEENPDAKNDMVYVEGYDPKVGLKTMRIEDGVIKPAQIIIPFKFKNNKGELLNIKDYIVEKDGRKYLNTDLIGKELLEMFSFRIPTQSHSSMSWVEVVGFLPEAYENMVVAPKEFTKQMGSDFDIDKLYNYSYKYYVNKEGKVLRVTNKEKDLEGVLHNEILDSHKFVMNHPEVIESVLKPLGFGMLKELAAEIYAVEQAKLKSKFVTPLSSSYQNMKYMNGRGGKAGVGLFSSSNTLNTALIAHPSIIYTNFKDTGEFHITFKGEKPTSISDPSTGRGNKKSDIHAYYQSASVDNEKESIMEKLNINTITFDSIVGLIQNGYEEDLISYLLNQDSVKAYVNNVMAFMDSTSDNFSETPEIDAAVETFKSLKYTNEELDLEEGLISIEDLKKAIFNKASDNYDFVQYVALKKFLQASELGKKLRVITSAINTDSKGLGKNFFEIEEQVNKINNLDLMLDFRNLSLLIGESSADAKSVEAGHVLFVNGRFVKPTSINGIASVYALNAVSVFDRLFPVNARRFEQANDEIIKITGKKSAEMSKLVFNEFKSNMVANAIKESLNIDLVAERYRLLISNKTNKSFADRVHAFKKVSKNKLIQRLEVNRDVLGIKPSVVTYNNNLEKLEEEDLIKEFNDLLYTDKELEPGYTYKDFAKDFVMYYYLTGALKTPYSIGSYISPAFLEELGIGEALRNIDINSPKYTYDFVREFFQNNPELTKRMKNQKPKTYTIVKGADGKSYKIPLTYTVDKVSGFPPTFASIKTDINAKGYFLYQYDYSTNTYVLVPLKGGTFVNEYGSDLSSIPSNNYSLKPVENTASRDKVQQKAVTAKTINNTAKTSLNSFERYGVKNQMNLNDISLMLADWSNDSSLTAQERVVSKLISDAIDSLPSTERTLKLQVVKMSSLEGVFESKHNRININTNLKTDLVKTVLHELLHGVSSRLIKQALRNMDFKLNLTEKQKAAILNLKNLHEFLKNEVKNGKLKHLGLTAEGLQDFTEQYESKNHKPNFIELRDKYYVFYGDNVEELVTMALTEPNTYKVLNAIKYKGQSKNIIEKIINYLKEFLAGFGDVNADSALEAAITNIVDLVISEKTSIEAYKSVSKSEQKDLSTAAVDTSQNPYEGLSLEEIIRRSTVEQSPDTDTSVDELPGYNIPKGDWKEVSAYSLSKLAGYTFKKTNVSPSEYTTILTKISRLNDKMAKMGKPVKYFAAKAPANDGTTAYNLKYLINTTKGIDTLAKKNRAVNDIVDPSQSTNKIKRAEEVHKAAEAIKEKVAKEAPQQLDLFESVTEFAKGLTKEERAKLRDLLSNGDIKFECE